MKTGIGLLMMVALVNLGTSWICGHSVYLATVAHGESGPCHPHSHGPFEHSHDSENGSDHPENRVGVKLLATPVVQANRAVPIKIHTIHFDVSTVGIYNDSETAICRRARSSPPTRYGKALLTRIERWLI